MCTLKALHKQRGCGGCYNLKLLVESHKNNIDYMKKNRCLLRLAYRRYGRYSTAHSRETRCLR